MALLWFSGFDHVNSDALMLADGWSGAAWAFVTGRFGIGNAIRQNNFNTSYSRALPGTHTTVIGGLAIRYNNSTTTTYNLALGNTGTILFRLTIDTGNLRFYNASNVQIGTSIPLAISAWHHIQFKIVFHTSTGSLEVRLNGDSTPVLNVTGLNTGSTGANQLWLGNQGNVNQAEMDDVWICDDTGGSFDTFLGDLRCWRHLPDGNGNSSQMVGSDADSTDNYLHVDETAADGDTSYVESSTPGDKDTYGMTAAPVTTGTVLAVKPMLYARKTDAGARSMCTVARLSGTEVDGPTQVLGSSYQYLWDIRTTKPGGGAWSMADLDGTVSAAEFGAKVVA